MKIIDAYWEKRNLGLDVNEIEIEETDHSEGVLRELGKISVDYSVVKLPSSRSDLIPIIQSLGYFFSEDLIHVTHDLHEPIRSRMHQRMYDAMSYRMMDDADIKRLYEEIRKGMFLTDRISQDDFFTPVQAANRYINWVKDLIAAAAIPYTLLYKEEPAGFIILQTKDQKHYESVLGASYLKYRNSGIGIVQKEQEIVKKLGGKSVETQVSTNNISQVKALVLNGYVPKSINHVFTKHIRG